MSFSSEVKSELTKYTVHSYCCYRAEIYGILMYCGTFSNEKIRISVENSSTAKRIQMLFSKVFGFEPQVHERKTSLKTKTVFEITEISKLRIIFDTFDYEFKSVPLHLNFGILEQRCCKISFLRGVFLTGGLVSDPATKYYLEISGRHYNITNELVSIMHEINFEPKMNQRKNNYVVYLKDSVSIEDFLTCIGACMSAVAIMQIKVEKELRNDINRRTNCDEANITKAIIASSKQIKAINTLKTLGKYDSLPDELKFTADIRLNNPELTLSELLCLFSPPISRPGLSHRLNKLIELASK